MFIFLPLHVQFIKTVEFLLARFHSYHVKSIKHTVFYLVLSKVLSFDEQFCKELEGSRLGETIVQLAMLIFFKELARTTGNVYILHGTG